MHCRQISQLITAAETNHLTFVEEDNHTAEAETLNQQTDRNTDGDKL